MKKVLISLLTIAIVGALITGGVMAVFTDTEQSGQNTFGTGTVDLTLGPTDLPITISNMAPGDVVSIKNVKVNNSGSLDLRYAMTTIVGGANPGLAGQLQVSIIATSGSLYNGPLNAAFIGNPAQGQDTGDRVLLAGTSEFNLGFTFSLPLATDTSWQGKNCDVTFVFHAEQTANNP